MSESSKFKLVLLEGHKLQDYLVDFNVYTVTNNTVLRKLFEGDAKIIYVEDRELLVFKTKKFLKTVNRQLAPYLLKVSLTKQRVGVGRRSCLESDKILHLEIEVRKYMAESNYNKKMFKNFNYLFENLAYARRKEDLKFLASNISPREINASHSCPREIKKNRVIKKININLSREDKKSE